MDNKDCSECGLSGGAIAGIVIGTIAGTLLVIGLIVLFCYLRKKKKKQQNGKEILFNLYNLLI